MFALSDGQLSDHEVYPNIHEIDACIDESKDVTHFESYFHNRSMNQMLATINMNNGSPVLKIFKLQSNKLDFRILTSVALHPSEKCVHLAQHQDVFLVTYESGQAEYIRFQIRLGGGSEQVTRFHVWKLLSVQ